MKKVWFLYDKAEAKDVTRLIKVFLKPDIRAGELFVYENLDMQAGNDRNKEIAARIQNSSKVYACTSPDFFANDFLYELSQRLLETGKLVPLRFVPIARYEEKTQKDDLVASYYSIWGLQALPYYQSIKEYDDKDSIFQSLAKIIVGTK